MNRHLPAAARRLSKYIVAMSPFLSPAAHASEDFNLRYAPGSGGADMSVPIDPGTYFQVPSYLYHGFYSSKSTVSVGTAQIFGGSAAGLQAVFPQASAQTSRETDVAARIRALLPRFSFMTNARLFGATLGGTVMLPLVDKRVETTVQVGATTLLNVDPAILAAATNDALSTSAITTAVNKQIKLVASAASQEESDKEFGVGDLEFAPLMRWTTDGTQTLFVPAVSLPTGRYDSSRVGSPGTGNFYTFRPAVQFGYIGDGWDFGSRVTYSVNTRNRSTKFKSGSYLTTDLALMRLVGDSLRVGAAAYGFLQTTRDTTHDDAPDGVQQLTLGKRGRLLGAGPAISWIKGAGELMLEARVAREFDAQDRPSGTAVFVTGSIPLR